MIIHVDTRGLFRDDSRILQPSHSEVHLPSCASSTQCKSNFAVCTPWIWAMDCGLLGGLSCSCLMTCIFGEMVTNPLQKGYSMPGWTSTIGQNETKYSTLTALLGDFLTSSAVWLWLVSSLVPILVYRWVFPFCNFMSIHFHPDKTIILFGTCAKPP